MIMVCHSWAYTVDDEARSSDQVLGLPPWIQGVKDVLGHMRWNLGQQGQALGSRFNAFGVQQV